MNATALEELGHELEDTATRLRAGELDPGEAARLVDRCAELAVRLGSGLDRLARDAEHDTPAGGARSPGQEQLL